MESITSEDKVKSIKVDVSDLGPIHNFPKISSLVRLGWTIKTVVPVSENNKPMLLFILEKPNERKSNEINTMFILAILILLGLISLII